MTIEFFCPAITAKFLLYIQAYIELNPFRQAYVIITPYKGGYLEYQYLGEAKQSIPSLGRELTYEFVPIKKQCPGITYKLIYERANISNGTLTGWTRFEAQLPSTISSDAPFTNVRLNVSGTPVSYINAYEYPYHWAFQQNGLEPKGTRTRTYQVLIDSATQTNQLILNSSTSGISIVDFVPTNPNSVCLDDCKFIVYRDGIEVFSRINAECPSVNLVPCQLDFDNTSQKTFGFGSLSLLAAIQGKGGNIPLDDYFYFEVLQDHHYFFQPTNALKTPLLELTILAQENPSNALTFYYVLDLKDVLYSAQYFSDLGCPPPIYSYICKENYECPEGTCKVDCGTHYCCYNEQGISIKSLPKEI
jgi:hypothetical protein